MGIAVDLMSLSIPERRKVMVGTQTEDLAVLYAAIRQEYETPYALWRDDPSGFIRDVLGDHLWSQQDQIARAVRTHRRVAVPSCHGPGKTFLAARIVCWWVAVHPPEDTLAVTTATTWRQVRSLLWPHIRRAASKAQLPGIVNQTEWSMGESIPAFGFSQSRWDEAAGQGIHAPHLLVVVDEAGGIVHNLGQNLSGLMTGQDCHLLVIGNPPTDEAGTWFETICEGDSGNYMVQRINAFGTPNLTGEAIPDDVASALVNAEWIAEVEKEYGEESAFYQARVLARFPKVSVSKAIPGAWVEDAMKNESVAESGWQRLGVDVAADGGDEMVVALADGFRVTIAEAWAGADAADQVVNAERVLEHILRAEARQREVGFDARKVRVKIDATGVGAGTSDVLIRMGKDGRHGAEIIKAIAAQRANDPGRYSNQRAEGWWTLREAIRESELRLDIGDREKDQLSLPKYFTDGQGRIQIQAKKDLKKKGMNSPDRADALILAIYEPEPVVETSVSPPPRDRPMPAQVGSRWG